MDDKKILGIDSEICSECKIYVTASSFVPENGGINPELPMIKIKNNGQKGIYIPVICRFCENAPCLDACPLHALFPNEKTGVTMVDNDECIGCGLCIDACQFGAIKLHPEKNIAVLVCDLCGD